MSNGNGTITPIDPKLAEDIGYIRANVDAIKAKLDTTVEDHENRLRALEKWRNFLAGCAAIIVVIFTDLRDSLLKLIR